MSVQTLDLEVTGMSCAACAARLEKLLNRQAGLEAAVNFASSRAVITRGEGAPDLSAIEKLVEKTGFGLAHREIALSVSGMSCAACSARIEKILNRLPGVTASVNLATEQAHIQTIVGSADETALIRTIEKAGFSATPMQEQAPPHKDASEQRRALVDVLITALFCLPFLAEMTGMAFGWHDLIPLWLQVISASVVQIYSARHFYRSAWHALRTGTANMNVLVCLGTSIAYGFSLIVTVFAIDLPVYFEASAFVILLVSLGRLLERARAIEQPQAGGFAHSQTRNRKSGRGRRNCHLSGRRPAAGGRVSAASRRGRAGRWRGHRW